MKFPLLAVLALGTVVTCARADYSHKEPFNHSGPFSATGTVSLHNVNGDVEVRTWDRNEILIDGVKSAKTDEELKKIDLTMEVSESRAEIRVRLPKRENGNTIRAAVKFTLTVPATAQLAAIDTVNSSVKIDGVRGPVQAETVNGGVRAANLGGTAKLETVNGSIEADFAAVSASQKLSFETVNGHVTVRLPKEAGFTLDAEVVNGHIDCEFPIKLGKRNRRSIDGTVGNGAVSVNAESVNGSISIEMM